MTDGEILLKNADKIHTTKMGLERIEKNLSLNGADAIEYCKKRISDKNCVVIRRGKNYYCEIDNVTITVNAHSFTVITAHKAKQF